MTFLKSLGFLFIAVLLAPHVAQAGDQDIAAQNLVLRHLYYREVYSGIVRDGTDSMRLEPLPFTKRLPAGTPDFDLWEGRGYEQDIAIADPVSDTMGQQAVAAGICDAGERPCLFSFTYLFAVSRSYSQKPDEMGIRYIITKNGAPRTEGVMWGSEHVPHYFLRDVSGWRPVTDTDEKVRMNRAVELAHDVHKVQLQALEVAKRIIRNR